MPIGYCFSYPTESIPGGDARLLRWTKGVDIREMVGQFVGKPLLDYLNEKNKIRFTGVKVLNDTIASLFAGLTDKSYDAYIGLIVGTGTNMATFIPSDKITKLDPECHVQGLIPVNLESGNFYPPFLTAVDDTVDATSDSLGKQRFEKAVSGMYLGDILKAAFPLEEFEEKFDARKLTAISPLQGYYSFYLSDFHSRKDCPRQSDKPDGYLDYTISAMRLIRQERQRRAGPICYRSNGLPEHKYLCNGEIAGTSS